LRRESLSRIWISALGDLMPVSRAKADKTPRAGSVPRVLGITTRSALDELSGE
jgi:hypothetical protein